MITAKDTTVHNHNLYSKFTNVNLSSNKDYLSYAYGNRKVLYYNDPVQKEKKKTKIALSLALVAISGIAIVLNSLPKGKFKLPANIKMPNGKFKDLKIKDKIANLSCNFTNIKDDLWDRVSKKTIGTPFGFIEKIGQGMTNLYKKWVYNSSLAKQYDKAYNELIEKHPDIQNLGLIQDFKTLFNSLDESILNKLHKDGDRISDNLFFKKGFFNRIINETVADTKINNLDEVKKALQEIQIPENLSQEAKDALTKFNEIRLKTSQELVPKLRDINAGNAPTDLITILASSGALAGAVAMEDDKEEKKSIIINLGIPLIATLGTQIYGTIKLLSGLKSLVFGLATGQIASQAAKLADMTFKNIKEKNENKNTQT